MANHAPTGRGRWPVSARWLGPVVAAAMLAGAVGVRGQVSPAPPPLLDGLLKANPSWTLLDPARDLHLAGDYTRDDLVTLGHWPPWVAGDFDRDGRPDVAAVIVERTAEGSRFGVIAVHARRPSRPIWIVPLGPRPYIAAYLGETRDVVVPAHCLECDTNAWYRWNGTAFEPGLHAVGDTVTFVERLPGRPPVLLFTSPTERAPGTIAVPSCGTARVLRRGGSPEARWYQVALPGTPAATGWVPATLLVEPIDCA